MKLLNQKLTYIVALACGLSAIDAQAARNNRREARQQGRIAEGRESGELTRKEARGLRAQQKSIDRAQRRAMKDGVLSPAEAAKLERKQDRASQQIYKQKHDEQKVEAPAEAPATQSQGTQE